jgi:hypothetical protein
VANLLSRSQNWRADGDGCVGLHLMQVSRRRAQGYDGCTEASAVRIVAASISDCCP